MSYTDPSEEALRKIASSLGGARVAKPLRVHYGAVDERTRYCVIGSTRDGKPDKIYAKIVYIED